jgi:uncharacterized protein (TIRG00374 family)
VNNSFNPSARFPWKSFLAVIVTIAVFIILFSKIDIYRTAEFLSRINPGYLAVSVFISMFSNIILPAEEWRLILRAMGEEVPFLGLLLIKLGIAPIKNAGPLKSGEFFRAFCLKKMFGISFFVGALSVFISLLTGLFVLFLISLIGCLWFAANPYGILYLSSFGLLAVLLFMMFFCRGCGINRLCLFCDKFSGRLSDILRKIWNLSTKIRLKRLVIPVALGIIIKLSELLVFFFIFKGLGVEFPLSYIFIFVPVTMLVSIIPVAFLGMGIREGVIVLLFSGYASPEKILGGGLLFSFVDYILPAAIGGFFTGHLMGKIIGKAK